LDLSPGAAVVSNSLVRKRLEHGVAVLENLAQERANGRYRYLGKIVEDRIIWRELLELELQQIDEQIELTAAEAAGDVKTPPVSHS